MADRQVTTPDTRAGCSGGGQISGACRGQVTVEIALRSAVDFARHGGSFDGAVRGLTVEAKPMRENGFGALTPTGSAELVERIARTLGVPVDVFYETRESLGRWAGRDDVETMSVELVEAFRTIENPAIRSGVLMLVKRLAGGEGIVDRSALLKD